MTKYIQYILCDLHSTVITHKNKIIPAGIDLIKQLSKEFKILFVSSHYFENKNSPTHIIEALNKHHVDYSNILFNYDYQQKNDGKIKIKLLRKYFNKKELKQLPILYAIDNSKKCIKQYKKNDINTLQINNI